MKQQLRKLLYLLQWLYYAAFFVVLGMIVDGMGGGFGLWAAYVAMLLAVLVQEIVGQIVGALHD